MKKLVKKLIGAALIMSLAVGYTGIPAHAKDMLNGYEVSGGVTTNSNSATASTNYSQPATIEATATVYFVSGPLSMHKSAGPNTASIGGVSATAYVPTPGGSVIGGKGEHKVTATTGAVWSYTSRTGYTN